MIKTLFFASLATLMLLIPMVASKPTPQTQERIDEICRSNEDYGFCNKVYQNNLQQPETGFVGLARIAIAQAQKNATGTLGYIRAQIPGVKDPAQVDHYLVCEVAYSILKKSFDKAFNDFIKGDYELVFSDERDTPRVQASCVTIFSMPPLSDINTLNEMNREMRILITMSVISTSILLR